VSALSPTNEILFVGALSLFELLVFTGQNERITVANSLKDVDTACDVRSCSLAICYYVPNFYVTCSKM